MVVFLMEKVPVSLRGEITRWMLELRPGVFVGNISALVREKLWEAVCQKLKAARRCFCTARQTSKAIKSAPSATQPERSKISTDFN